MSSLRRRVYRRQWDKHKAELKRLPMLRRHRRATMERFWKKRSAELAGLRRQMKLRRGQVKADYPFSSWNQFLQDRAGRGQEEALAVLRSRKVKVWPERPATGQPQKSLSSIARMKEILGNGPGAAWKYRLDKKGTVIFSLPGGGIIRDSGVAIRFRPGSDNQARAVAEKLARARWSEAISFTNNSLIQENIRGAQQNQAPSLVSFGPSR